MAKYSDFKQGFGILEKYGFHKDGVRVYDGTIAFTTSKDVSGKDQKSLREFGWRRQLRGIDNCWGFSTPYSEVIL